MYGSFEASKICVQKISSLFQIQQQHLTSCSNTSGVKQVQPVQASRCLLCCCIGESLSPATVTRGRMQ